MWQECHDAVFKNSMSLRACLIIEAHCGCVGETRFFFFYCVNRCLFSKCCSKLLNRISLYYIFFQEIVLNKTINMPFLFQL